jgi:hypothetical protein
VVALLAAALALAVREPWHGPILLSLSTGHGIDAGDLPVVPLVALAVVVGRRRPRRTTPGPRPTGRDWVGPVAAVATGAVLLATTATSLADHGTLVPSAGGTVDGTIRNVIGPAPSPVGTWTSLAMTYDGADLRLFVDGAPVATERARGSIVATSRPLWIGGNQPYGEYFDGLVDEARVYDRALDEAEIRSDMATPAAAGRPGLVAAWSFDAGSGPTVADDSGHGNTGTISGARWSAHGRFGGALRFDGDGDRVRVPAAPALDVGTGLTVSAWVRPAADQRGWRTVLHREQDNYFLVAGTGLEGATGWGDHLAAAVVLAASAGLAAGTLATRGRWLGARRRAWRAGLGLFLAGCLVDAAVAPRGTLVGPALLAVWFAATARDRLQAVAGWLVAAALAAGTVAAVADLGGIDVSVQKDDGGLVRAAALGVVLCVAGLVTLASADPRRAREAPEG